MALSKMADELDMAIEAMSDDWLSIATFIEHQFETYAVKTVTEQGALLESLYECLWREERHSILSSVAWDLVRPLTDYWIERENRPKVERLLNLVLKHGNPREVLLKLLEALEHVDEEDSMEEPEIFDVRFRILEAVETILKAMQTRRPRSFLEEYTSSLITMLCRKNQTWSLDEADRIRRFIQKSLQHGAFSTLLSNEQCSKAETESMNALVRVFLTQIVEYTSNRSGIFFSLLLVQKRHPSLNLAEQIRKARNYELLKHQEVVLRTDNFFSDKQYDDFLRVCMTKFEAVDSLWNCIQWAADNKSTQQGSVTIGPQIVRSVVTGDVPFSPAGSLLLLAYAYREQDSVLPAITLANLAHCESFLLNICSEHIEHEALLDSCLYLCARLLEVLTPTHQPSLRLTSVLTFIQALSYVSVMSSSAEIRYVSHFLSKDTLILVSPEERLEYHMGVMLECPWMSLKLATLGIVKDEFASNIAFWNMEDNVMGLLSLILTLDVSDDSEEHQQQYWSQCIMLIIFLLQRQPTWHLVRNLSRDWIADVREHLENTTFETELHERLLEMHIARVHEILLAPN